MTLKGQNLRILTRSGDDWMVVAMATSCTVTLTANTDDASHKDVVGMASTPSVVSKSWQMQVDSLDVTNITAILTAIASTTKFHLMWDETSTDNNQTAEGATFARSGYAYLTDGTFAFNNRENSTKNITFSGVGELMQITSAEVAAIVPSMDFTKGQFVRLFLGSDNTAVPAKVIAAATQLQLHVSLTTESASTKDTVGDWDVLEPTQLSYDISTSALVRSGDTITSPVQAHDLASLEAIYEASTPVTFQIAAASGANQRVKGDVFVSGSVILTQLTINAANRQNATFDAQMQGVGPYQITA